MPKCTSELRRHRLQYADSRRQPETEAGREHRLPLSPQALVILDQMRAIHADDFVFPGSRGPQPISNMAMTMALRRMGRGEPDRARLQVNVQRLVQRTNQFPGRGLRNGTGTHSFRQGRSGLPPRPFVRKKRSADGGLGAVSRDATASRRGNRHAGHPPCRSLTPRQEPHSNENGSDRSNEPSGGAFKRRCQSRPGIPR